MIPAKSHYACLAMLELALQGSKGRPVVLREITQRHEIPQPFLVQILQQLKIAGLVSSTRGSQGGYHLLVPPDQVTLLDILEAVGGDTGYSPPVSNGTAAARELSQVWQSAADAHRDTLGRTRLGDLVRQCESPLAPMFYI